MAQIEYTTGKGVPHRTFEDEFLTHRPGVEWWYCTGFLTDEQQRNYAFQFTLARIRLFGIRFHLLLTALTDLQTGKHYYAQRPAFFNRGVTTTSKETSLGDVARVTYAPNEFSSLGDMRLSQKGEPYKLQLRMTAAKAPIWQCDDGRLQMGITDDPGEFTFYFTFTHLLADGVLTLNGKTHKVKGQVWFDRQGGPFTATNVKTNWEWFSLRFFDNEEIMLFSFPQTGYRDGTFIAADGSYRRLNNYEIEPLGFLTEPSTGFRFSTGWKISMPGVKEENYMNIRSLGGRGFVRWGPGGGVGGGR